MKKILLLLSILFFLIKPQVTFAELIHSFDVNIVSHKNGLMDVSESINYDFESSQRHGIYRYIPLYTKVGDLYRISKIYNIKILRDGRSEQVSTTSDAKLMNLKIGNPDKTITGAHSYEIDYTVENGIGSNYSDHDEIYWNGTGNGWEVWIDSASITFKTDSGVFLTNLICFTGSFGSKDTNCQVSANKISTSHILYSNEGLTGVAIYPVGTFPKSVLSKNPPQTFSEKLGNLISRNLGYIYFFLNIFLPILLIFWYQKHKNKKRFGPPVVSFDFPKDESGRIAPAEAGTIDNAMFGKDDVTATIFDLAIRKYIKLVGTKKIKKFAPDETDIKIQKLKSSEGLNVYEKTLFDRFFQNGDEIDVKDLKIDFYLTFQHIEDDVFSTLKKKGYFVRNPKYEKGILLFLGILSLISLNIILAFVFFYLARKLIGRTQKGDEVDFKVDGLKLFLKTQLRNYDWQAQKFYTVEQMIPYAMALGFIDKFMEQLKIIKPDYNPVWYSGYSGSFYTNYGLFYSGLSTNITTAAPSSSGAGGGGFSSGGGGGGGGGSW